MKNSKFKKILSIFLALLMIVGTIPASVIPVGAADNAGGAAIGGSSGNWNATYNRNESMWKVSVYIAKKDTTTVTNSKISDWYNISGGKEIIIRNDVDFDVTKAWFGKSSKLDFLTTHPDIDDASVSFVDYNNFIWVNDASAPEVPIDGNSSTLADVKAYFGRAGVLGTLLSQIAVANGYTANKAGVLKLFADKKFTIDGYTKKGSEWEGHTDIEGDKITLYPAKVKSFAMEFLIVYEPIVVQHFSGGIAPSDGGTSKKISCFTATELAVFRDQGNTLGGLIHLPTYVGKSVHLEDNWLGYKKSNDSDYSKTKSNSTSSYPEYHQFIYNCGGWGMRNAENLNNALGDYSVNVKVDKTSLQAGESVTVTWTIKNYGPQAKIPFLVYGKSGTKYYNLYSAGTSLTLPVTSNTSWKTYSSLTKFAEAAEKGKNVITVNMPAGSKNKPSTKTYTKTITLHSNYASGTSIQFSGIVNRRARSNELNPGWMSANNSNWNNGWGNNYNYKTVTTTASIEAEPTITINLIDTTGAAEIAGKRFSVWCVGASTLNSTYVCECGTSTTGVSGGSSKTYECSGCGKAINQRGYEIFATGNQTNVGFAGIIETDENGQATINLADFNVGSGQSANGLTNTTENRTATGISRTYDADNKEFQWTPNAFVNGGTRYSLWNNDYYKGNLVTFEDYNTSESTSGMSAGGLSQKYTANDAGSESYPTTRYLRNVGIYGSNLTTLNTLPKAYGALIQGGSISGTKWNWRTGNLVTFVVRPIDAADPSVVSGDTLYTDSVFYYSYNDKTVETFGYQSETGETQNSRSGLSASEVTYIANIENRLHVDGQTAKPKTSSAYKFKSAVSNAPVNFGFVTRNDNSKLIYEDLLYKNFSYSSDKNAVFDIEIKANPQGTVEVDVTQDENCKEKSHNVFEEGHEFVLVDSWGETHFATATENGKAIFNNVPDGAYEIFPVIKGDINSDGKITEEDYNLLSDIDALTSKQKEIADVTGNGTYSKRDKELLNILTQKHKYDLNEDGSFDASDYQYLSEYYAWQQMRDICLGNNLENFGGENQEALVSYLETEWYVWKDEETEDFHFEAVESSTDATGKTKVIFKDIIEKIDEQNQLTELEIGFLENFCLAYGFNTKLYLYKDSRPLDEAIIEDIAGLYTTGETSTEYTTYITQNDLARFENELDPESQNASYLANNKFVFDFESFFKEYGGYTEDDILNDMPYKDGLNVTMPSWLTNIAHWLVSKSGEDSGFTLHTFTGGTNTFASDDFVVKVAKATGVMNYSEAPTNYHEFEITCRDVEKIEPIVRVTLHDNTSSKASDVTLCRHCSTRLINENREELSIEEINENTECRRCKKKQGQCIHCDEMLSVFNSNTDTVEEVEYITTNDDGTVSVNINENTVCHYCQETQATSSNLVSGKRFAIFATAIHERGNTQYLDSFYPYSSTNNIAYLGMITTDEYGKGALNLAEENEKGNNVIYNKICALYDGLEDEYETPAELFGALFGKNSNGETILKRYRPDGIVEVENKIQIVVRPLDTLEDAYTHYYSYLKVAESAVSPIDGNVIIPFEDFFAKNNLTENTLLSEERTLTSNVASAEGLYDVTEDAPSTTALIYDILKELMENLTGGFIEKFDKKGYGTFTYNDCKYIDYFGCTFSSNDSVFDKNIDVYINDYAVETIDVEIKADNSLHIDDYGEEYTLTYTTLFWETEQEIVQTFKVRIGDILTLPVYDMSESVLSISGVNSPYWYKYDAYDIVDPTILSKSGSNADIDGIVRGGYSKIVYTIKVNWTFEQQYKLGEGATCTLADLRGLGYTLTSENNKTYKGTVNSKGVASNTVSTDLATLVYTTTIPDEHRISAFSPVTEDDFKNTWNSDKPYTVTQEFIVDKAIINVNVVADETVHPDDKKEFEISVTDKKSGKIVTETCAIGGTVSFPAGYDREFLVEIIDVSHPYQCLVQSYSVSTTKFATDVTFNISALWTIQLEYKKGKAANFDDSFFNGIEFYFNTNSALTGSTVLNSGKGVFVGTVNTALNTLTTITPLPDGHNITDFTPVSQQDFLDAYNSETPYCVKRNVEIYQTSGTVGFNIVADDSVHADDKKSFNVIVENVNTGDIVDENEYAIDSEKEYVVKTGTYKITLETVTPYRVNKNSYEITIEENKEKFVTFVISADWVINLNYKRGASAEIDSLEGIEFYFNNTADGLNGRTNENGSYAAYVDTALTSLTTTTNILGHYYSAFEAVSEDDFKNTYASETPYCVTRDIVINQELGAIKVNFTQSDKTWLDAYEYRLMVTDADIEKGSYNTLDAATVTKNNVDNGYTFTMSDVSFLDGKEYYFYIEKISSETESGDCHQWSKITKVTAEEISKASNHTVTRETNLDTVCTGRIIVELVDVDKIGYGLSNQEFRVEIYAYDENNNLIYNPDYMFEKGTGRYEYNASKDEYYMVNFPPTFASSGYTATMKGTLDESGTKVLDLYPAKTIDGVEVPYKFYYEDTLKTDENGIAVLNDITINELLGTLRTVKFKDVRVFNNEATAPYDGIEYQNIDVTKWEYKIIPINNGDLGSLTIKNESLEDWKDNTVNTLDIRETVHDSNYVHNRYSYFYLTDNNLEGTVNWSLIGDEMIAPAVLDDNGELLIEGDPGAYCDIILTNTQTQEEIVVEENVCIDTETGVTSGSIVVPYGRYTMSVELKNEDGQHYYISNIDGEKFEVSYKNKEVNCEITESVKYIFSPEIMDESTNPAGNTQYFFGEGNVTPLEKEYYCKDCESWLDSACTTVINNEIAMYCSDCEKFCAISGANYHSTTRVCPDCIGEIYYDDYSSDGFVNICQSCDKEYVLNEAYFGDTCINILLDEGEYEFDLTDIYYYDSLVAWIFNLKDNYNVEYSYDYAYTSIGEETWSDEYTMGTLEMYYEYYRQYQEYVYNPIIKITDKYAPLTISMVGTEKLHLNDDTSFTFTVCDSNGDVVIDENGNSLDNTVLSQGSSVTYNLPVGRDYYIELADSDYPVEKPYHITYQQEGYDEIFEIGPYEYAGKTYDDYGPWVTLTAEGNSQEFVLDADWTFVLNYEKGANATISDDDLAGIEFYLNENESMSGITDDNGYYAAYVDKTTNSDGIVISSLDTTTEFEDHILSDFTKVVNDDFLNSWNSDIPYCASRTIIINKEEEFANVTINLKKMDFLDNEDTLSSLTVNVSLVNGNGTTIGEKTVITLDDNVVFNNIPFGTYSIIVEGVNLPYYVGNTANLENFEVAGNVTKDVEVGAKARIQFTGKIFARNSWIPYNTFEGQSVGVYSDATYNSLIEEITLDNFEQTSNLVSNTTGLSDYISLEDVETVYLNYIGNVPDCHKYSGMANKSIALSTFLNSYSNGYVISATGQMLSQCRAAFNIDVTVPETLYEDVELSFEVKGNTGSVIKIGNSQIIAEGDTEANWSITGCTIYRLAEISGTNPYTGYVVSPIVPEGYELVLIEGKEEHTLEELREIHTGTNDTVATERHKVNLKYELIPKKASVTVDLNKMSFLNNDDNLSSLSVEVSLVDKNGNVIGEKTAITLDNNVVFNDIPYGTYTIVVTGVDLPYYVGNETEITDFKVSGDIEKVVEIGAKGRLETAILNLATQTILPADYAKGATVKIYSDEAMTEDSLLYTLTLDEYSTTTARSSATSTTDYFALNPDDADYVDTFYIDFGVKELDDCHTYFKSTGVTIDWKTTADYIISSRYSHQYIGYEFTRITSPCKAAFDVTFTGDTDKIIEDISLAVLNNNDATVRSGTLSVGQTNVLLQNLSMYRNLDALTNPVTSYSLDVNSAIPDYFEVTKESGNETVTIEDFRKMHESAHTEKVTYNLDYIYDYAVSISAPATVDAGEEFEFTVTSSEVRGLGEKPTIKIYCDNDVIYEGEVDLTNGVVTQTFSMVAPADKENIALTVYINQDGKYREDNWDNNVDSTIVDIEKVSVNDLYINPVNANEKYCAGEEVIASFVVHNLGAEDILQADNVPITFEFTYPTESKTMKTIKLDNCKIESVVIPGTNTAGEKSENLVSIRFTIPDDCSVYYKNGNRYETATVKAYLNPDKTFNETSYDNNTATIVNKVGYFSNSNFEGYVDKDLTKPDREEYKDSYDKFSLTTYSEKTDSTSQIIGTKSEWSFWRENSTTHELFIETYIAEMTVKAIAKPDNRCLTASFEDKNGDGNSDLLIGSGYALTFAVQPTIKYTKIVDENVSTIATDETIVDIQYVRAFYPEQNFGYLLNPNYTGNYSVFEKISSANNNLGTSQFTSTTPALGYDNIHDTPLLRDATRWELQQNSLSSFGSWIEGNEEVENELKRKHFTPLWYKDGEYNVICDVNHAWTPDGSIAKQAYFTTYYGGDIIIDGSVYDDYYTVR